MVVLSKVNICWFEGRGGISETSLKWGKFDTKIVMCVAVTSPFWWLVVGPLAGEKKSPTAFCSFQPLNCGGSVAES